MSSLSMAHPSLEILSRRLALAEHNLILHGFPPQARTIQDLISDVGVRVLLDAAMLVRGSALHSLFPILPVVSHLFLAVLLLAFLWSAHSALIPLVERNKSI